jgi:biotin carboxyl carrier protein
VEAMKAFTELRAEADGVIDAILVETGQEVEASQILFRLGQ